MSAAEMLSLDCFSPLCILGKGSYAHVLLVEPERSVSSHQQTIEAFALKIIDKVDIEFRNLEESIFLERDILNRLKDCPFTTNLVACFQGCQEVCFVLEYCPGGDLFEFSRRNGKLTEQESKFYISQIILAIQAAHNKDIVYRDLKPENILIDANGYLKLADFGRADFLSSKKTLLKGLSGTPQYMAPEMVNGEEYGKCVDWWAVGCLMFELLVGKAPFTSTNRKRLYQMIKEEQALFPEFLSKEAKNLINNMLCKNPHKRFNDKEIINHDWFKGFNWNEIKDKSRASIWKPEINENLGTQNFNKKFIEMDFDSVTSGLSKENHLKDFYFESDGLDWIKRFSPYSENDTMSHNSEFEENDEYDEEDDGYGELGRCDSDNDYEFEELDSDFGD